MRKTGANLQPHGKHRRPEQLRIGKKRRKRASLQRHPYK
jgi:hypothetical protein